MEDKLIELLQTLNSNVFRQGSVNEYPDTFFTFWNNSESGEDYYDNEVASVSYDFDVNVYSSQPSTVYSLLKEARSLLKANGFVCPVYGYDVTSDEETHTGRGMNVIILNKN